MASEKKDTVAHAGGIAILGMAGRFPGASDLDQFWDNLSKGVESVTFFSDDELTKAGVTAADLANPRYVKAAPVLQDVELFDAAFFDYSPREARLMDPQHRFFLECAWEALENAGYDPLHVGVPVGVYGGAGGLVSSYLLCHSRHDGLLVGPTGGLAHISNDKDFLTTRVSYKLNLKGPSVNVQSACSTSLVAVHIACQSLFNHECDMALAGGVSIRIPVSAGYVYEEGGILSPDGHCRAFDARAQGTIFGSGVGVVVLKRLQDALADGDPIRAVIRGTAINNDGGDKLSYTAASEAGQSGAIAEALALAEFDPDSVTLIEAHGTATALGDPVEVAALSKVFRGRTQRTGFCAIGSVKTNIGHTEAAAGIAGLIKAVLAMEHRQIPASLHFRGPNPRIDFQNSPFFVNTRLEEWSPDKGPRRAGVNSLGIGGTNAFVALEESPPRTAPCESAWRPGLLCLSAETEDALGQMVQRYIDHLHRFPDASLSEVCYTTQTGRTPFGERLAIVAESVAELRQKLGDSAVGRTAEGIFRGHADSPSPPESPSVRPLERKMLEDLAQRWVQGALVRWLDIHKRPLPLRMALPTYPFQRQSYWGTSDPQVPTEASSDSRAGEEEKWHRSADRKELPFPGRRLPSPLRDIQYDCPLGIAIWPQLGEHRVYGQVIVPGAWYMAMAMAAAPQALGLSAVTLRDVFFPRALALADNEVRTVQLVLTTAETEHSFQVWSLVGDDDWLLHAQGALVGHEVKANRERADLQECRERCGEVLDSPEFYRRMRDRHIDLGASFQWNVQVECNGDEIISRVRQPVPDTDGFVIHPGLIDACIQAVISQLPPTYLPLGIDECRFLPTASPPSWLQARFRQADTTDAEVITADVRLFNEQGGTFLELLGLSLKRASAERLQMLSTTQVKAPPVAQDASLQLAFSGRGALDNLQIRAATRRTPAAGEVEIRVRAAGLNFRDVLNLLGTYPGDAGDLGLECTGEVSAVGPGVGGMHVGDAVLAVAFASFKTFVCTPAILVRAKPHDLTYEEAATIPVAFLSAQYGLNHVARIAAGQRVLIHAAAGGVGLAAVQLARAAGAEVFATCGSPAKRDYLHSLGIEQVLSSRTADFAGELMKRTGGRGVNVVLNSLSGDLVRAGLSVVAPGGHFVELGKIDAWGRERVAAFRPDICYSTIALDAMFRDSPALVGSMLGEVIDGFRNGRLRPLPLQVFAITEAAAAFRFMAQAKHIGKVVFSLPDPLKPGGPSEAAVDGEAARRQEAPAGLLDAGAPLRDRLRRQVEAQAVRVLGLDSTQPLNGRQSLLDLGLDSLMAVELINGLEKLTGCRLPSQLIFNHPCVDGLADYLAELKTAAGDGRRKSPAAGAETQEDSPRHALTRPVHAALEDTIPRLANRDALPLSFAQERLWFLDRLEPENPAHNLTFALRLRGSLQAPALDESIQEIVRRHHALRTILPVVAGHPIQATIDQAAFRLQQHDLRDLPLPQREHEARRLSVAEARRPFDLSHDFLLRASLVRLDDAEHWLLLTVHHIAFDGWSTGILFRELGTLYATYTTGAPSSLAELPVQYADFAVWQRGWLQGDVLEQQVTYWRKRMAGAPALLELPTDHPRPAVQSYRGARQTAMFDRKLALELEELSRREGVTLFMTLLVAFQALLARYTGQEDVVVGCPFAGRNRAELEGLIGFFVNTLPLRCDLSGNPTFHELLRRAQEGVLEAHVHQDLPFTKLVAELNPERTLSYSPLFQILFQLRNPREVLELAGLQVENVELDHGVAPFDLAFDLFNAPAGLSCRVEYCADLFEPATVDRLLTHFQVILTGIAADPQRRLAELPLLTEAERQQLLVVQNQTGFAYPTDATVDALFEVQVERTPDRVAVVFEGDQLTYGQLNARANQLAHYLRRLGAGPETLVAIALPSRLEQVVGLLGVLKAGGTYLPLDPDHPRERLAFILEDAQVPLLLAQEHPPVSLSQGRARAVFMDRERATIDLESTENPASTASADQLAYLIYTSGSAGQPKGVEIPHRSVVNLLTSMQREPGLAPHDVLLAVTTLSFDIAALEILLPLITGARVVLASHSVAADGVQLAQALAASGATVMQATPATWRLLLETGWEGTKGLKILCGGEALSPELANRLLERGDSVWNLYGPTETTIWSAAYRVQRGDGKQANAAVPIGRPIGNTQIYVLDGCGQPVPTAVPGELCIGGVGLARGYRNRPELTAAKFIANPFTTEVGARLYKTGDRARWRPDENIEFLGRLDYQFKLRGFRIEPAEVEAEMVQHPGVGQAVVVLREDRPNDKRLVAYFMPASEPAPTPGELRNVLRKKLPDYMIPSVFVALDRLPLTPNGKIDRRALPAPNASPQAPEANAPPRTALEREMVGLWAELLGLKSVGIHDDFFERGGDSLLAVRLITQIEERFHKRLPVGMLFERPTAARLADAVTGHDVATSRSLLVPIRAKGSGPALFCVHGIGGEALFLTPLARHLAADCALYGLRARGLDGEDEPDTDVRIMAARYVEAIQTIALRGPYFLAGFSAGGIVAFEMAQQLSAQGHEVGLLAIVDQPPPERGSSRRLWTPQEIGRFLQNVPRWIRDDMLHSRPEQLVRRARGRLRMLWQASAGAKDAAGDRPAIDIEAMFGVAQLPPRFLKLVEVNSRALADYVPQPYPGRIDLFRARTERLGRPRSSDLGWGSFAAGGVRIHVVTGTHATIVEEPNVRVLANKLSASLAEARKMESEWACRE